MAATYTVEVLKNEPIVLFTAHADYHMFTDLEPSIKDIMAVLEQSAVPMVYVQDLLKMDFDWNEVMTGATQVSRGENPLFHHPKVKKLIVTTVDPVLIKTFQGMNSAAFGNAIIHIYSTLDDAMAAARAALAE